MSNKRGPKPKSQEDRKTIPRIAKSGRKYYWNPLTYQEKLAKSRLERNQLPNGLPKEPNPSRIKYESKTDEYYLRYVERKLEIRNKYDKWVFMSREQWQEYYREMMELLHTDEDFNHYVKEINITLVEKAEIKKMKKNISKKYNSSGEDYRL
jgi:hypothetical protein